MEKDYITITGMEYYFGAKVFKVGDVMSFGMFYSCALYLTSSKYVLKKYVELKELHKEYA